MSIQDLINKQRALYLPPRAGERRPTRSSFVRHRAWAPLMPNFFTINGKAYPATERVNMSMGERLLVRFIGSSSGFIHPMHIHGGPFRIVETDGYPVPEAAQLVKDTVNVAPGERYDVIWEAREPGRWLLHCHINHHVTNDNREEQGGGGLMLIIDVAP